MTIHEQEMAVHAPTLGEHGEPCVRCAAPLAHDQRYCLNCGLRRGDSRVPFEQLAPVREGESGGLVQRPVVAAAPGVWWRELPPAAVGAALGALGLIFALGLLIGSVGDGSTKQVAAAPQVIRVSAPAAAAQPAAQFTGDWPSGKDGFTVQLQTLPKSGTQPAQVDKAKAAAQAKGAADAGALDADQYSSLDPGNYVIYAGVLDTRKQAKRSLGKLKKSFPGARVIEVSAGGVASGGGAGALSGHKKEATVGKNQLKGLQKLSPDQYQKKSGKLPDTTKLPGKVPKKDKKAPGGGQGGGQVIG